MSTDLGILIARVFFGTAIAAHGAQKLFGWFRGYGIAGTGGFFEKIGFRSGPLFATAAGLSEFGGGILLLLGLFTPAGAAAVFATMLVAMVSVHVRNGFFSTNNGIEVAYLYAAAALALVFTGAGEFSMDAMLGLQFTSQPHVIEGLLALSVIGAAATLTIGRHAQPQGSATEH
jgi:putative oxidoreductase